MSASGAGRADLAGYGQPLALDWSAYTRVLLGQSHESPTGRLSAARLQRFAQAVTSDELFVCGPFRLEARYSARDAAAFEQIDSELDGFRQIRADVDTWILADQAQQALANSTRVSHRVKLADLLVAACAHQAGVGVLHYDKDYDALASHTALSFDSVWIAPRGSVD